MFEDTSGKLLGLNTEESLQLVLDLVKVEHPDQDLILATGDISQDASLASYERFNAFMEQLPVPCYWLPGNHDSADVMRQVLDSPEYISPCVITRQNWRIIMLDSSLPKAVPGELNPDDLAFLEQALQQSEGFHVMVCLHHHPVPMQSRWLDSVALKNPNDFFAIVDQYTHVKAIVWGHVHQEFEAVRNGVNLYALPSTCVQFKPNSKEFAVDDKSPGYRWFELHDDGRIDSGVSRVIGVEFEVDYSVKGY